MATNLLRRVAELGVENGKDHGPRQVDVRLEERDHLRAAAGRRHHKHVLPYSSVHRTQVGAACKQVRSRAHTEKRSNKREMEMFHVWARGREAGMEWETKTRRKEGARKPLVF